MIRTKIITSLSIASNQSKVAYKLNGKKGKIRNAKRTYHSLKAFNMSS